MRGLAAVAVLFTLGAASACASARTVWRHPTKPEHEFYKDRSECRAIARQAVASESGAVEGIFVGFQEAQAQNDCILGRGWRQVEVPK